MDVVNVATKLAAMRIEEEQADGLPISSVKVKSCKLCLSPSNEVLAERVLRYPLSD